MGGAWEIPQDLIVTTCLDRYRLSLPAKETAICRCMSCNSDLKGTRPVPLGQLPSRQGLVPNPDPVAASRDGSPSAVPAGPGLNAGVSVPIAGQHGSKGCVVASPAAGMCQGAGRSAAPWLLHYPMESRAAFLCCEAAPCSPEQQHQSCCWKQPAAAGFHLSLFTAVIAQLGSCCPLVNAEWTQVCAPLVLHHVTDTRITIRAVPAGEMRRLQREAGEREQHSPRSTAGGSPPRSILDFMASASNAAQAQQGQVWVLWSCALAQLPTLMAGCLLREH